MLELRGELEGGNLVLVTDDLDLRVKARHRGFGLVRLDDAHRLPDTPDEDDRRRRELEQRLARYESREPQLALLFDATQLGRIELRREVVEELPDAYFDAAVDRERARLGSVVTGSPKPHHIFGAMGAVTAAEAASYGEAVSEYLEKFGDHQRLVHRLRVQRQRTFLLEFSLRNAGTGPAEDVDVRLSFPSHLKVTDTHPVFDDPAPPEAPRKPQGFLFDVMSGLRPQRFHADDLLAARIRDLGPPENVSKASILDANGGTEVEIHVGRVKHHQSELMPELFVTFEEGRLIDSFGIDFVLNAGNLIDEVRGRVDVVFSHP
jgi:hypothetical protein